MTLDDPVRQRQPEPGPLSDLFRRKEGVENLPLHIGGNPGTRILEFESNALFDGLCTNRNRSPGFENITRIHQ